MENYHIYLAEWSNSTEQVEGIDVFVKVYNNTTVISFFFDKIKYCQNRLFTVQIVD